MNSIIKFLMFLFPFLSLAHASAEQNSKCNDQNSQCWKGFYLIGQLGGGWTKSNAKFVNANYFNTLGPAVLGTDFHFNTRGFIGGGALGYNFQYNWFVIGLEAGAQYLNLKEKRKSPFFPVLDVYTYQLNWLADAKGRIGFAYRCFLISATGGWAGAKSELKFEDVFANVRADLKKWVNGWTVGAEAAYKFSTHLSLGLAYDYIQLKYKNKKTSCSACGSGVGFGRPIVDNCIKLQTLTARIGVHF